MRGTHSRGAYSRIYSNIDWYIVDNFCLIVQCNIYIATVNHLIVPGGLIKFLASEREGGVKLF